MIEKTILLPREEYVNIEELRLSKIGDVIHLQGNKIEIVDKNRDNIVYKILKDLDGIIHGSNGIGI